VKVGNSWSYQSKLIPTGFDIEEDDVYFGYSVSLSHDGNVLVAGGPGYKGGPIYGPLPALVGANWVFRRSGTLWTQDGSPIISDRALPRDTFYIGQSVEVSSDGNTFVTSGFFNGFVDFPIIFIYAYTNGLWVKHTQILIDEISNYYLPVSISGDGNTIILGRSLDNSIVGTVDIFVKTNDTWTYQTTLYGTGTSISQGVTVSLSYLGDVAAFTGYTDIGSNLWIFNKIDGVWTQNGVAIPTAYTISAKLSGDGKTLVTGSSNTQEIRIYKN
jgi:hypothetical protein